MTADSVGTLTYLLGMTLSGGHVTEGKQVILVCTRPN